MRIKNYFGETSFDFSFSQNYTVCPGSSDPTESNHFIQSSSCDLKLFCSVHE